MAVVRRPFLLGQHSSLEKTQAPDRCLRCQTSLLLDRNTLRIEQAICYNSLSSNNPNSLRASSSYT